MLSHIRSLAIALLASAALPATAAANTSALQSPVTRQLSGVPCSVTASFGLSAGERNMSYGGGVSCARGVGQKTLNVVPQVFNVVAGKPLWFNISLVGRYQGPTQVNPLRLSASTTYVPSHTYRLLVYGRVTLPDGRQASTTVCSGECKGSPTLTIGSSYTYDAQPPTTASLQGVPCSVGQNGLRFTLVNGSYVINYGAFSACRGTGPTGKRTVTVSVQVANRINGRNVWFTVSGSSLSTGPTTANPALVATARTGFLGHAYRIMASTTVRYPSAGGTVTRSATVYSAASAP